MFDGFLKKIKMLLSESGLSISASHLPNYIISSFGVKIFSLMSLPILTHLLTPSDYGILNIFGTYAIIFSVVPTLNLQASIARYYFYKPENIGSFIFQIFVIQFVLLVLFNSFILYKKDFFSQILNIPKNVLFYFGPIISLYLIKNWIQYFLRAKRESQLYRNYNLICHTLGFFSTIIFIYLLDDDVYMGKIFSELFIFLISIFYFFKVFKSSIKIKIDIKQIKFMLGYSLGLMPAYLGTIFLSQIDRIMLNNYMGNFSAGIYSLSYNLSSVLSMIALAMYNSWLPDYYKLMDKNKYSEHDRQVLIIIKVVSLIACSLILFSGIFAKIITNERFHSGLKLIPIIIYGIYFSMLTPVFTRHISYKRKTYLTSIVLILSGVLNVLLNFYFIPIYGLYASAYTTLISYMLQFFLMYLTVKNFLRFHTTSLLKIFNLSIPVLLCFGFSFIISDNIYISEIVLRFLILLFSFIILFKTEIKRFNKIVS